MVDFNDVWNAVLEYLIKDKSMKGSTITVPNLTAIVKRHISDVQQNDVEKAIEYLKEEGYCDVTEHFKKDFFSIEVTAKGHKYYADKKNTEEIRKQK